MQVNSYNTSYSNTKSPNFTRFRYSENLSKTADELSRKSQALTERYVKAVNNSGTPDSEYFKIQKDRGELERRHAEHQKKCEDYRAQHTSPVKTILIGLALIGGVALAPRVVRLFKNAKPKNMTEFVDNVNPQKIYKEQTTVDPNKVSKYADFDDSNVSSKNQNPDSPPEASSTNPVQYNPKDYNDKISVLKADMGITDTGIDGNYDLARRLIIANVDENFIEMKLEMLDGIYKNNDVETMKGVIYNLIDAYYK